jgi:hypothetical protein
MVLNSCDSQVLKKKGAKDGNQEKDICPPLNVMEDIGADAETLADFGLVTYRGGRVFLHASPEVLAKKKLPKILCVPIAKKTSFNISYPQ